MKTEVNALFAALSFAVCGEDRLDDYAALFSDEEFLQRTAKLAAYHDLAHLLYYSLKEKKIIDKKSGDIYNTAEDYIMSAAIRYERLSETTNKVCALFEKNEIPYIPLKGAVLRSLYPEPFMRTSCDTDIMVNPGDVDKAARLIKSELGGKAEWSGDHDIPIYFENGTHIELHFSFSGLPFGGEEIMKDVFSKSTLKHGTAFCYEMPDDLFYYYHIAHMAKHIKNGGCGIKPFIDLYLLDKQKGNGRAETLKRGGLYEFSQNTSKLSSIWMSGKMPSGELLDLAKYILRGGSYGNQKTKARQNSSELQNAAGRIFLPYSKLKFHYKELENHKWLYPYCAVKRLLRLAFKTLPGIISTSRKKADTEKAAKTAEMMKQIGL